MSVPPQGPGDVPDGRRQPKEESGGMMVAAVVGGAWVFVIINVVVWFFVKLAWAETGALVGGAMFLALVAFGGGIVLILTRRPLAKGIGIGLMIGWALMSVLTAGICTGLNPWLYQ